MKLENWYVVEATSAIWLNGNVYGNPLFKDGTFINTSTLKGKRNGAVVTQRSVYELGEIAEGFETLYPDMKNNLLTRLEEV
jgi:hypothetical protein